MFERLLSENLGETAKKTLRTFANRKRMTQEDYLYAFEAYNGEVMRRRNIAKQEKKTLGVLPQYVEPSINIKKSNEERGNKKVIASWTISYEYRYKSEKGELDFTFGKWYKKTIDKTSTGKKNEIIDIIKDDFYATKYNIEMESPIITRNFKWKINSIVEVKNGNGLDKIKMKNAYSFGLSGEEEQKWDTHNGTCVFDYLIYLFGNVKGFKKLMTYEKLNEEFKINEYQEPLDEGVSIEQIGMFCNKWGIAYYALDMYENTIKMNIPSNKKKDGTSLIFRIINGHMYPIENYEKRQSIIKKNYSIENIKAIDIEEIKSKKEKPIFELVYPTEEINGNQYAFNHINTLNKIPYPIKQNNLYVEDGNIKRMIIDNKLILTEPINEDVKEFYEKTDRVYQGECLQNILYELWQETYGNELYKGELMSSYCPKLNELLSQQNIKNRTHYGATKVIDEDIKDLLLNEGAVSCDVEKCYSSLLLNPMDKFMKLNTINTLEVFDDFNYYNNDTELPFGLYVVNTDDLTLLHQSNIYSNKILDFAKKNNIEFEIIYKIVNCDKIDKNYFDKIINTIKEKTTNKSLIKQLINTITGCLGKTYGSVVNVGLTNNLEEVWENNIIKNITDNDEIYFKELYDDNNKLFMFGKKNKTKLIDSGLPIYIQILDWSNIKLYQMIKEMGGECVYRKTDCAVCIGGNTINEMEKDENDITKTWGSFRNEDCSDESVYGRNYKSLMKQDRHIIIPDLDNYWNNATEFNSSNQWKDILNYAIENKGLFIDGRAGTGKSFIIHKGVETNILDKDQKYRLAFTNKASRNINGTTIHKSLGINSNEKSNIKSITLKYAGEKIIIIDEIGMISLNIWKKILLLKRTNPKIIFILLGDKRQCRPIENIVIDYFNSPILKYIVNNNKCELTERQRYNEELWNFLEDYYEKGIVGKLKKINQNKINKEIIEKSRMICYFNSTRDNINDLCMDIMKPNNCLYIPFERELDKEGNEIKGQKAKSAYIYEGLPIMCIKNNTTLEIINSDEFIVKNYDENFIVLKGDDKDLVIEHKDFHKNFVVNYIATTHKLQGTTISKDLLIFDWYPNTMCGYEYGLCLRNDRNTGYTALSRVKSLEQIYIIN